MKEKKKSWMHSLFAYAQGEKKKLALSVVLSVLSVLLGLAPFYCMYALICQFAAGQAISDSERIHRKIEWGYLPGNALHLAALKCGSAGLALAAALSCLGGGMPFSTMLLFVFYSFGIFASLEPLSDSAHTLGVIDDAMDQLEALQSDRFLDADGRDIPLSHYDIEFRHVDFGYDGRRVLRDVSFRIPEGTSTASVDPENEHLIQQAISELTRGKTIITIAHRLATVRSASQILVVADGRIAEAGTHEELLRQGGIYRRFTEIRARAEGWRIVGD